MIDEMTVGTPDHAVNGLASQFYVAIIVVMAVANEATAVMIGIIKKRGDLAVVVVNK
jgi:hypothetical protein